MDTGEALHGRPGIGDKYIGDEVMVVFSTKLGSADPLNDAIEAAAMSRRDALAYCPHIGIASGHVIVGYAGTPLRYDVSVFGAPVALAARCAGVKPETETDRMVSSSITMPGCSGSFQASPLQGSYPDSRPMTGVVRKRL